MLQIVVIFLSVSKQVPSNTPRLSAFLKSLPTHHSRLSFHLNGTASLHKPRINQSTQVDEFEETSPHIIPRVCYKRPWYSVQQTLCTLPIDSRAFNTRDVSGDDPTPIFRWFLTIIQKRVTIIKHINALKCQYIDSQSPENERNIITRNVAHIKWASDKAQRPPLLRWNESTTSIKFWEQEAIILS